MTRVELNRVYLTADTIRRLGIDGGAHLTSALNGISHDGIGEACGSDELGLQIFQGYSQLAGNLVGAGSSLEESLITIGDGVSAGAGLLAQTDGENAEAVKAADLGLQPDGKPLPPAPANPSPDSPGPQPGPAKPSR